MGDELEDSEQLDVERSQQETGLAAATAMEQRLMRQAVDNKSGKQEGAAVLASSVDALMVGMMRDGMDLRMLPPKQC